MAHFSSKRLTILFSSCNSKGWKSHQIETLTTTSRNPSILVLSETDVSLSLLKTFNYYRSRFSVRFMKIGLRPWFSLLYCRHIHQLILCYLFNLYTSKNKGCDVILSNQSFHPQCPQVVHNIGVLFELICELRDWNINISSINFTNSRVY